MTDDHACDPDEPVTPQIDSDRTRVDPEPWVARGRLRDALAEAVASYASTDAAARSTAPAETAFGDQPATASGDRPAMGAPAEANGHATRLHPVATPSGDHLAQLQRLQADFENYRRRVRRDSEALALHAGEGVIESLLPVVDGMRRALEAAARHEEGQLVKGVELVAGQLSTVLASHGLDEVPAAPGMPFDPNVHEAVAAQESAAHTEGMICAVLEPGYLLHGRLLRPARVIVAT